MIPTEFTPGTSLIGGAMIGLAAVVLMYSIGRIAGISGILGRLLTAGALRIDNAWAWAFVFGLVIAPVLWISVTGSAIEQSLITNRWMLGIAGLLTGIGVAVGSGCTSGHGVCGLSRLSTRSLAATVTFMLSAALTVYVVRHLAGAGT